MSQPQDGTSPPASPTADEVDPLTSAPPGRAFEEAASAYHGGLGEPGSEGPAYRPSSGSQASSPQPQAQGRSGGPLRAALDTLEVPLKAANRLLAGVPVLGRPLSEAARVMWEQLNAASGRR